MDSKPLFTVDVRITLDGKVIGRGVRSMLDPDTAPGLWRLAYNTLAAAVGDAGFDVGPEQAEVAWNRIYLNYVERRDNSDDSMGRHTMYDALVPLVFTLSSLEQDELDDSLPKVHKVVKEAVQKAAHQLGGAE